jgi:hypothetical protein
MMEMKELIVAVRTDLGSWSVARALSRFVNKVRISDMFTLFEVGLEIEFFLTA